MTVHGIINYGTLTTIFEQYKNQSQMIPLRDYLKLGLKPRGTDPKKELNSHFETMLTEDLCEVRIDNDYDQLLALGSIGNKNQTIHAMVHGYNPENPESGFERPVVEEGPHMIIGIYAIDQFGRLHIFRTLQMRTNRLVVDTPRGFASAEMLENGEQLYHANEDEVKANLFRIMKEETGNLVIQEIKYLGADVCNTSFVISKSACYAVQISYPNFISSKAVLDSQEVQRRLEQFQHEGIIGGVVDMTLDQYLAYKKDPRIIKDMAADHVSDFIVMDYYQKAIDFLTHSKK